MKKKDMKSMMRKLNSIYSVQEIENRLNALAQLGTLKHWEPVTRDGKVFMFHNVVSGKYMNQNFEDIEYINGVWTVKIPELPKPAAEPEPEYFTPAEMKKVKDAVEDLSISHMRRYGSGDSIYPAIGILGGDEHSPIKPDNYTIGFELEYNFKNRNDYGLDDGDELPFLDTRLGHIEEDCTVGAEFDSHIFTWAKLKKAENLFKAQFRKFAEVGFVPTGGAGLHIHIGRNAFSSQRAFEKFYFILNCSSLQKDWEAFARRVAYEDCYYMYRKLDEDSSVESVKEDIDRFRYEHPYAVNQQHSATYEVRIFQTTLSTEILYGSIEMLINLVEFCNGTDRRFSFDKILKGQYAEKLRNYISCVYEDDSVDIYKFTQLSREEYQRKLAELLNDTDVDGIFEFTSNNTYNANGGAR